VISLAVGAAGWVGFRSPGDYAAFKFPPLSRHDPEPAPVVDVKTLHAKIGELTLENDFLAGALGKAGLLPSAKR
jgi:hypothetical protein